MFEVKEIYLGEPTTPFQLMQFTGLKDKNDKEIYDGDIIGTSRGRIIGHVEGCVRGYCYDVIYAKPRKGGDKRWSLYAVVHNDYNGKVKVLGNIFENPELIKS
jgi:uncharacterized phage protein (TIGR01671 family)